MPVLAAIAPINRNIGIADEIPVGGEHKGRVAQDAERDIEIAQIPEPEKGDAAHGVRRSAAAAPISTSISNDAGAGNLKRCHAKSPSLCSSLAAVP